jgi:hypothetical protein
VLHRTFDRAYPCNVSSAELTAAVRWTVAYDHVLGPVGDGMMAVSHVVEAATSRALAATTNQLRTAGQRLGSAAENALATPRSGVAGLDKPQRSSWKLASEVARSIAALPAEPTSDQLQLISSLLEQSAREVQKATLFIDGLVRRG